MWTIATHSYSEAHFATFPPKLVEPCILAGTSAKGCCRVRRAVGAHGGASHRHGDARPSHITTTPMTDPKGSAGSNFELWTGANQRRLRTGWNPACECGAEHQAVRRARLFRWRWHRRPRGRQTQPDAILLELSPKYAEMARARIVSDAPLLAEVRLKN